MTEQQPRPIDVARAARLVEAVREKDSEAFASVYDDMIREENSGTSSGRPILAVMNVLAGRVALFMDTSSLVSEVEAEHTLREALEEMPNLDFPDDGQASEGKG